MVAITKKKKALDVPPAQFIVGSKGGDDDGADLDDDTQVCSCHNVVKGDIGSCVKRGATTLAEIKKQTKAMAGCGGCTPLITNIFKAEMAKAGVAVSNNICSHFAMSRQDLFNVVKVKKYTTFNEIMENCGVRATALGCEICKVRSCVTSRWFWRFTDPFFFVLLCCLKPCVGNILSSTVGINAHVMDAAAHPNQVRPLNLQLLDCWYIERHLRRKPFPHRIRTTSSSATSSATEPTLSSPEWCVPHLLPFHLRHFPNPSGLPSRSLREKSPRTDSSHAEWSPRSTVCTRRLPEDRCVRTSTFN